jgi:hypothetical protein
MAKVMATSLNMSGNAITNLPNGVAATDAATVGQLAYPEQVIFSNNALTAGAAYWLKVVGLSAGNDTDCDITMGEQYGEFLFEGYYNTGAIKFAAIVKVGCDSAGGGLASCVTSYDTNYDNFGGAVIFGVGDGTAYGKYSVCYKSATTITDLTLTCRALPSANFQLVSNRSITRTVTVMPHLLSDAGVISTNKTIATDKISPNTTVANTPSVEFGLVNGSVGASKIKNNVGEVRIGQASAAYAYYETDATNHYFNKPLEVNSNVAINAPTVTITPASGMTTNGMSAYKGCDKTLIIGGQITKSSAFVAGDTLFTLASGGRPPFATYVTVATSATAVVTLTISTAGVVTLSTIHHGSVGAGMTLSFQTIRA